MVRLASRLLRHTALVLVWAGLLLACAAQPAAPAPTATPPRPLLLWHTWAPAEERVLVRLIEQYNQTSAAPVVLRTVPIATLVSEAQDAIGQPAAPDLLLVQSHMLGKLAAADLIVPLTNQHWPADDRLTVLPALRQSATLTPTAANALLYGVPISFDTLGLYYHRERTNLQPDSMQQVLATSAAMARPDATPPVRGLAYTLSLDKTLPYLPAMGGAVLDEQGELVLADSGRPGTELWLEWQLALRRQPGVLATSDSIVVDSALRSQEAWITVDWAHALPLYERLWGDALAVAVLPPLEPQGAMPQPYVQSELLVLAASTSTRDPAPIADLIAYLHSPDVQQVLLEAGRQPARADVPLEGDTPLLRAARSFREQARHARPLPPTHLETDLLRSELQRMQRTVLRGLIAPSDAITQADAMIRAQREAGPAIEQ